MERETETINTSRIRNIRTWKRVVDVMFGRGCMYEDKSCCQIKCHCITCWTDYIKQNKERFK